MIFSMTGYASVIREAPRGVLSVELRSVNSRFLDLGFRIADELRPIEPAVRELITGRVGRGKVECRVSLQPSAEVPEGAAPNAALLRQLAEWQRIVRREIPETPVLCVADVLRWPGMFGDDRSTGSALQEQCIAMAREALEELIASRAREGEKLAGMITERIHRMTELVAAVAPKLPGLIADYQEKLAARLRDALAAHDEERIRQEVGLFAARIDVAEELGRLRTHLVEVERVIQKGGLVGKRLDFLMQELNREANTLASKSVASDVTTIALELKLLIEQMREQVQNLE